MNHHRSYTNSKSIQYIPDPCGHRRIRSAGCRSFFTSFFQKFFLITFVIDFFPKFFLQIFLSNLCLPNIFIHFFIFPNIFRNISQSVLYFLLPHKSPPSFVPDDKEVKNKTLTSMPGMQLTLLDSRCDPFRSSFVGPHHHHQQQI